MADVEVVDEYTEEEIVEQIRETFTGRAYEVEKIEKMNENIYDVFF